jgi:hypothetical protein
MRIWKWFLRILIIVSRTVKKVQMKRIILLLGGHGPGNILVAHFLFFLFCPSILE